MNTRNTFKILFETWNVDIARTFYVWSHVLMSIMGEFFKLGNKDKLNHQGQQTTEANGPKYNKLIKWIRSQLQWAFSKTARAIEYTCHDTVQYELDNYNQITNGMPEWCEHRQMLLNEIWWNMKSNTRVTWIKSTNCSVSSMSQSSLPTVTDVHVISEGGWEGSKFTWASSGPQQQGWSGNM